ncbi:hypothetical protein [Salinispora cortesiana]|uniref:hypothetical protein n=1 Tax=Salinispora cortesiana TaxID=1305843 RepID=UPI00040B8154|nr:hypothetical protein [Salinispora cortesiana]
MRDEMRVVEPMQRALRDIRWPEAAEIRARARRRSRRTALLAGVVLVGTLAVAAVAVVNRPTGYHPPNTPPVQAVAGSTPASRAGQVAPTRSDLPPELFVQQSDLVVRTELHLNEAVVGGTVPLGLGRDQCGPGPEAEAWMSRSQTLLRWSAGGPDRLGDILVVQDLYRFRDDGAARFFAEVRQTIVACPQQGEVWTAEYEGTAVNVRAVHRWDTPRVDFAGDESLLLRHSSSLLPNPALGELQTVVNSPELRVVLRVGDLVTVLFVSMAGEAELVRLADVAARRMCIAASPPC